MAGKMKETKQKRIKIDEKIQDLIKWIEQYPKARINAGEIPVRILQEYSQTQEEYEKLAEEYAKLQRYYVYVRHRFYDRKTITRARKNV